MRKTLLVFALLGCLAATAQGQNISRTEGRKIQVSLYGERGYGAGITAGLSWFYGNGFSVSTGIDGTWNQRPNLGSNWFAGAWGEAKYSILKGNVSPFVAARLKARFLFPRHLKEGTDAGSYSLVSSQTDLFGIGIAGVDFSRFALWGGIGGGPSLFSEEAKDASLRVSKESHTYMDLTYCLGLTYWF